MLTYCCLLLVRAPGGGRTHTWTILSRLPLPLGYRGLAGKSTRPFKDLIQHGFGQLTSEGVLLTGMVTPEENSAIPVITAPLELRPMAEPGNSLNPSFGILQILELLDIELTLDAPKDRVPSESS